MFGGAGTNSEVGEGEGLKFVVVPPPHVLALQVQLVAFWWALSRWSAQFSQFLVCCSSTHGAPPCSAAICKSWGGTCPRALWSRRHWRSL